MFMLLDPKSQVRHVSLLDTCFWICEKNTFHFTKSELESEMGQRSRTGSRSDFETEELITVLM